MRKVKLSTGREIELDGDLLAILEALYRDVALGSGLRSSYEDMIKEIQHVVGQMSEADRKQYLVEALSLNYVTYENEMLDAYMRKLTAPRGKGKKGSRAAGQRSA